MSDELTRLRAALEAWRREQYEPLVRKRPERKAPFQTESGLDVAPLYTALDRADPAELQGAGLPGEFPYTRGVYATGYRGRLWTMRQYAGFNTAAETNARFKYLLEQGQTGLSVAFDLPTQIGYDSDHDLAEGEVGKVGVPISSIEDMEVLLDGLPLEAVSTSMTINTTASILLALYVAVARRRGIPADKLSGTVQNDILKEYVARGTHRFPPAPSLRLIADTFRYTTSQVPRWNPISISGYHIREAGATAVQELAFTLANAQAYVQAALDSGLAVDDFAPRLSFFFNAHNDLFEEVAKFRAARRLWAGLMRDRYGATSPESWRLRFHAQTAGSTLTAQQMDNNVVRVAVQALAAVLGGCQSLHTNGRDEALALPTQESARLALRTQQVLAEESGVASTVDPLGGSWYVETLTDRVAEAAQAYLDRIQAMGGAVRAIEQGYMQKEIQDSAYRHQIAVEAGDKVVVGVNRYTLEEAPPRGLFKADPTVQAERARALEALRKRRDGAWVKRFLEDLRDAAADPGQELMPLLVEGLDRYVTLGEVCAVYQQVFGEYEEA